MRRRWLAGLVVAVLLLGSSGASADPSNWAQLGQIILWLQRIDQTLRDINDIVDTVKEKLSIVYPNGALRQIDWILRDFRTGEARPIDPRLLDLLWRLRTALDTTEPYEVISGYRSPRTNAMLRRQGRGVSRISLHMQASAIDVRVPGRSLIAVREAALALRLGGVGYYPTSDFVHVDVGRVRYW